MAKTPWYKREYHPMPVSKTEIVTMAENLATMLKAGLTVAEAFDTLTEQATGKLRRVVKRVNDDIQGGELLGDALQKFPNVFSPVFVSAVRVGEGSGTLAQNLETLARQLEKDLELRQNIQGAMLYPLIILATAVILGLSLATFVLPQMAGVFESLQIELPATTRFVMWMAELFRDNGTWLTPAILAGIVALVIVLRQRFLYPITHRILLSIPGIGEFVHEINRARFARMLGTMLGTGVPIQEALEIGANALPNLMYRRSIRSIRERIEGGESFSESVEGYPKLYPKMVQRMISVGERSGTLGDTLSYLARYYEQKVRVKAKNLSVVIEPILLVIIGLIVGFLALSIFTPIYSVTEGLRF